MIATLLSPAFAADMGFTAGTSTVEFHNYSSLHDFDGKAKAFSGRFDPATGAGELTIQTDSLTTFLGPRDARLAGHCMEPARFPTLTFRVASVAGDTVALAAGMGNGSIRLVGELSIRDATRAVEVSAAFAWEGANLRLKGRYDLKWGDYGVPDPSIVLSTLYPDMNVTFDVLAQPR